MATCFIKLAENSDPYPSNCFPVRSLIRHGEEGSGAWLVERRLEEKHRFSTVLTKKPRTFSQIREERRRKDNQLFHLPSSSRRENVDADDVKPLDGFYLLRHCCVDDPADLCSINIASEQLTDAKEKDFEMFDNVAYINAAENFLQLESFAKFPALQELEMQLNGLRGLKTRCGDFTMLEMLDLSYNNLSNQDVLSLGEMQNLRVLHLTGNGFTSLPHEIAHPIANRHDNSGRICYRFPKLEILMLDENKLSDVSVFAALAGLHNLRHLNLEKNDISGVPQLRVIDGKIMINTSRPRSVMKSAIKSGRRSQQNHVTILEPENSEDPMLLTSMAISSHVKCVMLADDEQGLMSCRQRVHSQADVSPERQASGHHAGRSRSTPEACSTPEASHAFFTEDLSSPVKQLGQLEDKEHLDNSSADQVIRAHSDGDEQESDNNKLVPGLPPFSELRYLSLAYNTISTEESLLAVAAWPMLIELVIHHNPLTTQISGDPPLLRSFLSHRLGINLIRKEESMAKRPPIKVAQKKSRKVISVVPKLPKASINDRLLLEVQLPALSIGAPDRKAESPSTTALSNVKQPLPPIVSQSSESRQHISQERYFDREQGTSHVEPAADLSNVMTDDQGARTQASQANDMFFLTQMDDPEQVLTKLISTADPEQDDSCIKSSIHDQYLEGYELLLVTENDEDSGLQDLLSANDITSNIRALKYALSHELLLRDSSVQLDTVGKLISPYRKPSLPYSPSKGQDEKVNDVLKNLQTRSTVEEVSLANVLANPQKYDTIFPEANTLLAQIQRRYNMVRVNSMHTSQSDKNMIASLSMQDDLVNSKNKHRPSMSPQQPSLATQQTTTTLTEHH